MTADNEARSLAATFAALSGLAALGVVLIGLLGSFSGLLAPLTGFGLFGLGMSLLPLLGLLLGLVGLFRTRAGARLGRERAWLGLGICGLMLVILVALFLGAGGVPPIHDITTSQGRDSSRQFEKSRGHRPGQDQPH